MSKFRRMLIGEMTGSYMYGFTEPILSVVVLSPTGGHASVYERKNWESLFLFFYKIYEKWIMW